MIAFTGQIWISIRHMIRKRKIIAFLMTFFVIFSLTFIISKTNVINPEAMQTKMLQNNLIYKNDIHVIHSPIYIKAKYSRLNSDIVIPKNKKGEVLFFNEEKIKFEDLAVKIFTERDWYPEFEIPFLRYTLFIDRQEEMSTVYELKKKLKELNVERISYSVKREGSEVPFYYKSKYVYGFYLPNNILEGDADITNKKYLKFLGNDTYLFNKKTLEKNEVANELKTFFLEKGIHSIRLLLKKNTSFEEYFDVFLSTRAVINEMRDEYSKKKYNIPFDSLDRKTKESIKEIYYWHVYESILD
ncbi:MAG: hypothetical protein JXR05_00970 [Flavobacteriaceae bacterium]